MTSAGSPEGSRGARLRVGTRGSALALAQSRQVAARLEGLGLDVELVVIRTSGDRLATVSLAQVGGKGLFIKELEEALAAGSIDLAVHSMKDMPAEIPAAFGLAAVPKRARVNDVLIRATPQSDAASTRGGLAPIEALARGARVGTGSLRRRAQIAAQRSDVEVVGLRGNIDTRLRKLAEGNLDAIVLAGAGLERLGLDVAAEPLDAEAFLPAPGQGALALESRADDARVTALVAPLHDPISAAACTAERAFLRELGANCVVPVAAWARSMGDDDGELVIDGLVASLDGRRLLRERAIGPADDAASLGRGLAHALTELGAREILAEIERAQST